MSPDVVYRLRPAPACNRRVGGSPSRLGSHPVAAAATDNGFERFYRCEYAGVVRLLVGMTGRRALAEELAQEALLSAYRDWPRVQGLDRPDLWLRRVAINRAVSTTGGSWRSSRPLLGFAPLGRRRTRR
jgi:DNA-directed RNA polymerase specialized sigma24 family protein